MTVETQVTKVTSIGNGVAFVHSFSPLVIYESGELVVTRVIIATDIGTVLVEGTGPGKYSVSPTSFPAVGATGSITYPADSSTALPATEKLVMKRVLVIEQQTKLQNQAAYFPKVLETALDKITMRLLQQQELLDRTVRLPISFTGTVGEADAPVASRFLRRNAANDAYEHVAVAATTGSASDLAPLAIAAAAAAGGSAEYSRADHEHPDTGLVSLSSENLFTARQGWAKGADIASASPLVLGTDGNYFDVTGTTGFSAITVPEGMLFMLQFDAVLTMTHGASLSLPKEVSITTRAGDILIGFATATNVTKVLSFASKREVWAKGADIASASPLVLGADGNYFDVTGTTGFSQITCKAGTLFMLQFDAVLTMTDGANLDLGGANVTTAAGDRGTFFAVADNVAQLTGWVTEGAQLLGAATQAQQEAATAINLAVSPGRQHLHPSAVKFHANFDGSAAGPITPRIDFNVVDVTDNGSGDYTVNIDNDFSSGDYTFLGMARGSTDTVDTQALVSQKSSAAPAAGTLGILVTSINDGSSNNVRLDSTIICVAGLGDQ